MKLGNANSTPNPSVNRPQHAKHFRVPKHVVVQQVALISAHLGQPAGAMDTVTKRQMALCIVSLERLVPPPRVPLVPAQVLD
jgi:hypothetical protein